MDKIVIVTSQPEPDYRLLSLASAAFPDCEIHIALKGVRLLSNVRLVPLQGRLRQTQ